jgi:heme O synthase-like polyprenyltransferase
MKSETTFGVILMIIGGLLGVFFDWNKSHLGFSGALLIIIGLGILMKIHKKLKIDLGTLTGIIVAAVGILIVSTGNYRRHSVPNIAGYLMSLVGTVIAATNYLKKTNRGRYSKILVLW